MSKSWVGMVVSALLVAGVVVILVMNLNPGGSGEPGKKGGDPTQEREDAPQGDRPMPAGFREYPIGDEVSKNAITVAAVYLPAIGMEGMPVATDPSLIHLEADIAADTNNPNGFTKDAFVPYLQVDYAIAAKADGKVFEQGTMIPMVALDGLHYGVNLSMPKAGEYTLTYTIHPPGKTLGRHSDPVTGVAKWWEPFTAVFEWDYPGPPAPIEAR